MLEFKDGTHGEMQQRFVGIPNFDNYDNIMYLLFFPNFDNNISFTKSYFW